MKRIFIFLICLSFIIIPVKKVDATSKTADEAIAYVSSLCGTSCLSEAPPEAESPQENNEHEYINIGVKPICDCPTGHDIKPCGNVHITLMDGSLSPADRCFVIKNHYRCSKCLGCFEDLQGEKGIEELEDLKVYGVCDLVKHEDVYVINCIGDKMSIVYWQCKKCLHSYTDETQTTECMPVVLRPSQLDM